MQEKFTECLQLIMQEDIQRQFFVATYVRYAV